MFGMDMNLTEMFGTLCMLGFIYLFIICPIVMTINKKEKTEEENKVIDEAIPKFIAYLSEYNEPVLYEEFWKIFCDKTYDKYNKTDIIVGINKKLLNDKMIYQQGRFISLTPFE